MTPATEDPQITVAEAIRIAQDLLSHRFGGKPELTEPQLLSGLGNALVLRVRVAPSPLLPHRSVVIKYNPVRGSVLEDSVMLREVVSYQFTTSLAEQVRPGPILLAYDVDRRIVVLTDVGDGDTFMDALAGADSTARLGLLRQLGTALGQMHAGTYGREQDFELLMRRQLRKHPNYTHALSLRDDGLRRAISAGLALISAAGIPVPDAVIAVAQRAIAALDTPFERAFSPFDISPDNIVVGQGIYFLDYEWAGYRNVGFDVACVIAGFPQYSFAQPVSDHEVDSFLHAWTREVRGLWPHFDSPLALQELVMVALVGWALTSLATMLTGGIEELVEATDADLGLSEAATRVLSASDRREFSAEEQLIRRDLRETFDALSRFARRGESDESAMVANFAAVVLARLASPAL